MLLALTAVPFVVFIKHLWFAELIKAVINRDFFLLLLLAQITCVINSCCSFNAREMGLKWIPEVLLPF